MFLREIYGRVEDCTELIYLFYHTYQMEGEKLTAYVTRLDQILHQVVMKGGMEAKAANKALMLQVQRGAQPLDPIVLQLRTRSSGDLLTYYKL